MAEKIPHTPIHLDCQWDVWKHYSQSVS